MGEKGKMKSIVFTYPDFRELPRGLKQMLVVSEKLFFDEVQTMPGATESHGTGTKPWWRPPQTQFTMDGHKVFSS